MHKHIACMHTRLRAWVVLCTQIGLVCSPDSIDTFIFLIQPNLAEIWAQARKHIACMHASKHIVCMLTSLPAWGVLCTQIGLVCYPYSIDTFIFQIQPNLAEIWAKACKHIAWMHTSLHARDEVCAQSSGMFSWFHRYFDLSDSTQFVWDMGLCT